MSVHLIAPQHRVLLEGVVTNGLVRQGEMSRSPANVNRSCQPFETLAELYLNIIIIDAVQV